MHVGEDGLTSSYRRAAGKGRVILWEDIEHLFVRNLFFTPFGFTYFFQGPSEKKDSIDVLNCSISVQRRVVVSWNSNH